MSTALAAQKALQVSRIAETLTGSEILKIAGEVNEKIKKGEKAIKSITFLGSEEDEGLPSQKIRRVVNLFHRRQVQKAE